MESKIAGFMFKGVGVPKCEKFLDLAAYRHKLVSGNVANVSTPDYRSRDIDFHAEFKRLTGQGNRLAGTVTHASHIPTGDHEKRSPDIKQAKLIEGDMNSIDIDKEISEMTRNELVFSIGARLLKQKFDGLRKVITSR